MSNDDIIRSWKEQQPNSETPDGTPPNPAGDDQLAAEDLENVAGGVAGAAAEMGTYRILTFGCCTDVTVPQNG